MEGKGARGRFKGTFASLRHPNYRLYFFGQLISLTGFWMQNAAQSWLVYDLTGSKAWLGYVGLAGAAPIPLMSLIGGAVADIYPKRQVLLLTETAMAFPPILLAVLAYTSLITVWHILALAFLMGLLSGLEMPVRQAFVVEMVGKEDLMNAIALNSSVFHSARIIGPAIAGVVVAKVGPGTCFLVNGLSYGAVVAALLAMGLEEQASKALSRPKVFSGFAIVWRCRKIATMMFLVLWCGTFSSAVTVLLPAIARDRLGLGPDGYGWLLSSLGVGAVLGALLVASFGTGRRARAIAGVASFWLALSAFALSFAAKAPLAAVCLVAAGGGMSTFFSSANTFVQTGAEDHERGRVMGVYSLVFGTMMPLGALISGAMAEAIDTVWALRVAALACFLGAAVFTKGL